MYNHHTLASIALGTLLITAFITIVAIKRVRRIKKRPDCEEPGANNSSSVDHNLYLLTKNSFYKTKIVGDGWFGTVYKAQSPNGKIVAVTTLNQSKSQDQERPSSRCASKKVMLQMVQIAAICISYNPANRPSMLNVLEFLKGIKPDL
ncbi:serine-threonine/tyrosine-protein kinase catalytic domain-containing protein [Artemisia annua]|uniref:Serine-threonine/tyrosine-protein kinase catalytic domain-containing protein n=1 Tax=Artemisia annua TaxID=35608 RepID=A0A2U1N8C8_ARTAN|nr:serine-threonine/tyrosine-protein kinase catalytic domain-containing protein [Artemisia annua]